MEGCYYTSFSITSVVIQFHGQLMAKLLSALGGNWWLLHSPYSYPLPNATFPGPWCSWKSLCVPSDKNIQPRVGGECGNPFQNQQHFSFASAAVSHVYAHHEQVTSSSWSYSC